MSEGGREGVRARVSESITVGLELSSPTINLFKYIPEYICIFTLYKKLNNETMWSLYMHM